MEQAAAKRRYDERHETRQYHDGTFPEDLSKWAEKPDAAHPYRYDDGVTILVAESDLYPDDKFMGPPERSDSPI